jgi:predicted ATPase
MRRCHQQTFGTAAAVAFAHRSRGIGKTTVALDVAERRIDSYEHGVWLIDLAPLSDPHLLPSAVTAALGLATHSQQPLPELIAVIRDKRMLLVLDNCEHVITSAAELASAVLRGAPNVQILATSREPLRARGEHLYRIPPLTCPPASPRVTATREALSFPAVQLFVERAARTLGEFELNDADAPLVAVIFRSWTEFPWQSSWQPRASMPSGYKALPLEWRIASDY